MLEALKPSACPAPFLWPCGATLLFPSSLPTPRDWHPQEIKTTSLLSSHSAFDGHLGGWWIKRFAQWQRIRVQVDTGVAVVPSWRGVLVSGNCDHVWQRLSLEQLISDCYQCIFSTKEIREWRLWSGNFLGLEEAEESYGARTFCVQIPESENMHVSYCTCSNIFLALL